jgi:MoxR-like ATPase
MNVEVKDFASDHARKLTLAAIRRGMHLLITGPRGSGKTELVLWAARRLNRPSLVCHLGSSADVEATLQGTTQLRNGETRFNRARVVEGASKPGTVVVLDELNRSGDSKAQGMLLSWMDEQRQLYLDQEDPDRRVVEVADGVVFVATANVGAGYHGTEPLDTALLDRMVKLELDYSPKELELLLAHGLGEADAKRVIKIAKSIRKQHMGGALTGSISTRGLVQVAALMDEGFAMSESFEAVIGLWDPDSRVALRTILKVAA